MHTSFAQHKFEVKGDRWEVVRKCWRDARSVQDVCNRFPRQPGHSAFHHEVWVLPCLFFFCLFGFHLLKNTILFNKCVKNTFCYISIKWCNSKIPWYSRNSITSMNIVCGNCTMWAAALSTTLTLKVFMEYIIGTYK